MKDEGLQVLVSSSTEQKLLSHAQRESTEEEAHIAGVVVDKSIALLDVSRLPQNLGTGRESSNPDLATGETSYHDADHTLICSALSLIATATGLPCCLNGTKVMLRWFVK